MDIEVLIADEGMVLTDGECYGKRIYLGENRSSSEFWQISQEVYEKLQAEEEEQLTAEEALNIIMGGEVNDEERSDGSETSDGDGGAQP